MIIRIDQYGNSSFVRCKGRLVHGIHVEAVRTAVCLQRNRCVVLDLSRVKVIDAAGLGLLVELHAVARAAGWRFVILNAGHRLQRAMRATGLDRVLPLWDSHSFFGGQDQGEFAQFRCPNLDAVG